MDSISKVALSLHQPQRADLVVLIMDSHSSNHSPSLSFVIRYSVVVFAFTSVTPG